MFIFYPVRLLKLFTNCRTFEWMNSIHSNQLIYNGSIPHSFLFPSLLEKRNKDLCYSHCCGTRVNPYRKRQCYRYWRQVLLAPFQAGDSTISVVFWAFSWGMIDGFYPMLFLPWMTWSCTFSLLCQHGGLC